MAEEQAAGQALAVRTPTEDWLASQTGVEIADLPDGRRLISLPRELEQRCILLTPISQVVQVDRNYSPIPRIVQIDPRNAPAGDVYKIGRVKDSRNNWVDQVTLTSRALAQIAERAGIEHVNTRRVYFPGGFETIVTARHRDVDGTWKYTTRSKVVDFEQRAERVKLDAIEKARKDEKPEPDEFELRKLVLHDRDFLPEKAETKAFSRCVRKVTGSASYARTDLEARQGRFFVIAVAFTPDYSDENVRALIDVNYANAAATLYGGEPPAIEAPREEIEEAKPIAAFTERGDDLDDEDFDGDEDGEPETVTPEADDVDDNPQAITGEQGTLGGEDWDDPALDEVEGTATEGNPMPTRPTEGTGEVEVDTFTPARGPFAGQPIEEILASAEGRAWLAQTAPRMRSANKRTQAERWLEWAGREFAEAA